MKTDGWLIVSASLIGVTFAWNRFWEYVIYLMESGVTIEPLMNTMSLIVGGLGLAIFIFVLVVSKRSEKMRPSTTRKRREFLATQLFAALVCCILLLWFRVPEDAGSPTLATMSVMGWAIVAHTGLVRY